MTAADPVIDPEIGFTSDVIRDPSRFVGRTDLVRDCIQAINTPNSMIAVYGKRGVGKSSLLRQLQQMALGDYTLATRAGINDSIPQRPRTYLTVYYACDSSIEGVDSLASRLCNDQNAEDGLLRLVPNDGKEIVEFSRSKEGSIGQDLKVINWGAKGVESSKYARVIPSDPIQTFRNFVNSVVSHQVQNRMRRDGLLILLDEFDVIRDKRGMGSLIKSLSSSEVKFAICGIGKDLTDLISDHQSVERLIEEGALHVKPMPLDESAQIIKTAENLFKFRITFDQGVIAEIASLSQGYPYFVQLIGKECVLKKRTLGHKSVDKDVLASVLDDIRSGRAFPTLESAYQKAIGDSEDRQLLLHLLADQDEDATRYNEEVGRVLLKEARNQATDLDVKYVDQLLPRLIEERYGPVLERVTEKQGTYEFVNPVFRLYVRLRRF